MKILKLIPITIGQLFLGFITAYMSLVLIDLFLRFIGD